ncbi:alginate export family protein [Hyphococcus sp.]|uniref:alginate export family protein n=1 Tax=Hyphococcus sp. TaxID=2038636 RepID=UPI003D0ECC10
MSDRNAISKKAFALALGLSAALSFAAAQETPNNGLFTFDASFRERVQHISNVDFTSDNASIWTQRIALKAGFQPTDFFCATVNVLNAVQSGDDKSPVDHNSLDLHEAFLDLGPQNAFLRAGRQELIFGSQRLIGVRDGTNVRRTWNGLRLAAASGEWSADFFAARPVAVEPTGVFNDDSDKNRLLAGAYATGPAPAGKIDLYYFFAETNDRATIEGVADQRRHSFGARLFNNDGAWFWNWEAVLQTGQQGDSDIRAWTVAGITGRRFGALPLAPAFTLSTNIASGDKRPHDGKLGTFDALYPRGNYFSNLALLGPANFFNVNPSLDLHPNPELTLTAGVNFYWRLELTDGVYSPSGMLYRAPGDSTARYVNTALSLGAAYKATERLSFEAVYTHSAPGRFFRETGPDASIEFLELTMQVDI